MKNEVKEKPILFSGGMVQAILDGRKTQTRRIMKPQPEYSEGMSKWVLYPKQHPTVYADLINAYKYCPYGEPGDILWVKETYSVLEPEHIISGKMADRFVYKADMKTTEAEETRQKYIKMGYPYKWKSSRFMPKEACRIKLLIEDIRVERLNDITEVDAEAEGVLRRDMYKTLVWEYETLWESINGKGSWDANPFVWVIKFKRI